MKKNKSKDNSAVVAVVCFVGILLFGTYGLFGKQISRWWRELFSSGPTVGMGSGFAADVSARDMVDYLGSVSTCPSISLRIVETTEDFSVEVLGPASTCETAVSFEVSRKALYKFALTPIEDLVAKGLEGVAVPDSEHPLSWKSVSIATNQAESVWTVTVKGVSGEGVIKLALGEAYAVCRINLPKLFPIWDYVLYVSPQREEVRVGGIVRTPASPPILPDLARGLCGYKMVAVVGRTVWFQVLYGEDPVEDLRRRWPGLEVNYRVLDNGVGFSSVRFEGGKVMEPGDEAVFEDDLTVLKLERNAFVQRHAVLFRYYDSNRKAICDMLCVTLQN